MASSMSVAKKMGIPRAGRRPLLQPAASRLPALNGPSNPDQAPPSAASITTMRMRPPIRAPVAAP